MVELHVPLDEKRYRYLQQRARSQATTVEDIVVDLIDADFVWQQSLGDDPVAALFGEISDELRIETEFSGKNSVSSNS